MSSSVEVDGPVAAAHGSEDDAQHLFDQVVLDFKHEASKKRLRLTTMQRKLSIETKNTELRGRNVTASVRPLSNQTDAAGKSYGRPENGDVWLHTYRIFALKRTLPRTLVLLFSAVKASNSVFFSTFSRKAIICQHSNRWHRFPRPSQLTLWPWNPISLLIMSRIWHPALLLTTHLGSLVKP